jgi:transposase-like Mu
MIKQYYSLQELTELDIPSLPKSVYGLRKKAERENWKHRQRYNYGGGREYAVDSMPEDIQNYILGSQMGNDNAVIEHEKKQLVQNLPIKYDELKAYQREVIDARAIILAEIDNMSKVCGGVNSAIEKFKSLVETGMVSDTLQEALVTANARSGRRAVKISRATIFNWRKAVKENGTILALAQKEIREADWPVWGDALLKLWQRPSKPSLAGCLEELAGNFPDKSSLPTYSAAQRFLKKLPAQIFNKGRYGSRELKKFKAYVSRDTSNLWPTAVYTADGHTFDAEVQNPLTGKPFRPEITTVIDVYTRKVVGWSVDLSERTNSVYMALARSIITHGIPAIWYVDNGKGFNNRCFDDNMVGLFARLGIEKKNSIAYNSQARGIGERIHQTIWVRAAKELATYMGADMDAQAKQSAFKKTRKEIAEVGASKIMMSWHEFKKFCEDRVEFYNNHPHRSLPEKVDTSVFPPKRRHMTPSEFWNESVMKGFVADKLTPAEIRDLYRYYEVRRTNRALVSLFNNNYFSIDLEPYHGRDVAVAYDVLDASKVWVYELADVGGELKPGKLIAEAIFEGNSREYFPISQTEYQNKKRAEGRIKRLQSHIDDAEAEVKQRFIEGRTIDIEELTNKTEFLPQTLPQIEKTAPVLITQNGERPVFNDDVVWAKWILDNPEKMTAHDKQNLSSMLKKPEVIMLFEAEDLSIQDLRMLSK